MKSFIKIISLVLTFTVGTSCFVFASENIENNVNIVAQSEDTSLYTTTHTDDMNRISYSKDEYGDPAIVVNGISTSDLKYNFFEKIDNLNTDKSSIVIQSSTDKHLYKASCHTKSERSKSETKTFVDNFFSILVDEYNNNAKEVNFLEDAWIAYCALNLYYYENDESVFYRSNFFVNDYAVKVEIKDIGEIIVPVKDGNVFVEFFADETDNSFDTFDIIRNDANTPKINGDIEGFTHTDIVEFEFVLPEDSDNSLTKEVAKPGETVYAVVDQYKKNRNYVHVLTLSGSLGEVSFWTKHQNMQLEESLELYSDNLPIKFRDYCRFEDDECCYYEIGKTKDSYPVQIRFNSGKLYSVTFAEDIECTNISHTSLVEDSSMEDKYGDKDKEAMIEQLEKDMQNGAKEQDLERYVTEMRTFEEDGSEGFDFYIAFLAQADMNISASASTPDWYDKLGDNVKATIVGITQTWAGKDRRNYTMIKFTGDDDSIWFDMSMITPSAAIGEKDCYVETIYSSLISFDGFQKIQNTIEYDTTSAVINFDNFENKKLTSVVFEIGKKKVEISADKIKHIGGGKMAYEKLW